jgi:anti-sigma factor RsiW
MICTGYRESLDELVDGTIGPIRRAELERHLEACPDCRSLLHDLQAIRDAAAALDPLDPPAGVWLQVAGHLRQQGRVAPAPAPAPPPAPARHMALLAIAAALVLAVGASIVMLLPHFRGAGPSTPAQNAGAPAPAGSNAADDDTVQGVETEFRLAEQHYQNAIAKLEQAARLDEAAAAGQNSGDQATIDPQTAAMLQKNLHVIDAAIAESRAALRAEPQSAPARDSLFDALKRKVALLQDTIALMNEMRKGNAAGAAQIVQGASKS